MANVAHSGLTAANLHEPKGAATATANQVYVADGAASGAWTTAHGGVNQYVFTVTIADASSATATSNRAYIVFPFACTVTLIYTVILGAIGTADNVLTCANHAGSSMGTITNAFSGSAAGDVDTLTPASNNTFALGERMSIISDNAGKNVVPTEVSILVTRTA